jgi:nucleotide-binding universal stress UspA family protein
MSPMVRVLVIANRTADSAELMAALRQLAAESPTSFTLLVPAVSRGVAWAADMKAGGPEAADRAEFGARRMRNADLTVESTVVGDPDPLAAASDALHGGGYDRVVVSTLPHGLSGWLRLSLPDRVRRITDVPVLHVTAHRRSAGRASRPRRLAGVGS